MRRRRKRVNLPDPTGRVLDYRRSMWGHAVVSMHFDADTKTHTGLIFGEVKPGDRIMLLTEADQVYLTDVEPLGNPPDMYRFTAKALSEQGIAHFDQRKTT